MTPAQIIDDLRAIGPQELPVLLYWLADHVYVARLNDGTGVSDGLSARQLLIELAQAAESPRSRDAA